MVFGGFAQTSCPSTEGKLFVIGKREEGLLGEEGYKLGGTARVG